MPRPISSVTTSSGKATGQRRGAHSSRGWPIKVRTIGAPISTPSVSPTHQAAQCGSASFGGSAPASDRAARPTLALMQAGEQRTESEEAQQSVGSASSSGWPHPAPHQRGASRGLQRAPVPMPRQRQHLDQAGGPSQAACQQIGDRTSPAARPASAGGPRPARSASAMPAAGNSGDALPGGMVSNRPPAPAAAGQRAVNVMVAKAALRQLAASVSVPAARLGPAIEAIRRIGRCRAHQTLNRKFSTSPSLTTYSLPSERILPASLAPCSPLQATKSSIGDRLGADEAALEIGVDHPAACGAVSPAWIVQARTSFTPAVK